MPGEWLRLPWADAARFSSPARLADLQPWHERLWKWAHVRAARPAKAIPWTAYATSTADGNTAVVRVECEACGDLPAILKFGLVRQADGYLLDTIAEVPPEAAKMPTPDHLATGCEASTGARKLFWFDANREESGAVLDLEAIRCLTDAERAAVAYVAMLYGGDCNQGVQAGDEPLDVGDPDAVVCPPSERYEDDRSLPIGCRLTSALELGCQCGKRHTEFVETWFQKSMPSQCYAIPGTATNQQILGELSVTSKGGLITLAYSGTSMRNDHVDLRGPHFTDWRETTKFERAGETSLRVAGTKTSILKKYWGN
jgi:hypothetical protein